MKTIIISDIKGKTDSIIPYGLNLAKNLESEVDILHIIDSRTQQGVQSAYSDSQTVVPGEKMSHEEIVEREKDFAKKELDKILSKEASRLNYPLKINTIVEEDSVEKKIKEQVNSDPQCLVLVNSVHDNFIFHSQEEILEVISNLKAIPLMVPGGQDYKDLKDILLISDFTSKDITLVKDKIGFLDGFKPVINAVDIARPNNFEKKESKSKALEGVIKDRLTPFKTELNIITGSKYTDTILDYIDHKKPDLVMLLKNKESLFTRMLQKKRNEKLIKNITVPVLYLK